MTKNSKQMTRNEKLKNHKLNQIAKVKKRITKMTNEKKTIYE